VLSKLLVSAALLVTPGALAGDGYDKASKHVAKALWKEYRIDKALRRLEKKYISKDVRAVTGVVIPIGRAIYERRITFQWSF
jgi:hypothetical protein